ncbi:hypothetical protein WSM22_12440 [Cytophagales bacterium WSM2-2]|nr:hypothetical protein WSM22_12440 [Cytophagales bacterium WSM2-2]
MKTNFLLLMVPLVLCAANSFATIRTVSNDANNPAQYADVNAAISAATVGDTIYVNGTQYLYSDFTITKKLVLIGAGYNSSNQFNLITQVNSIYLFRDGGVNDASGTVITGFRINSGIGLSLSGTSQTINSVRLFRNMIRGIDSYPNGFNNWTIYNNIFTGSINGRSASSNVIIQNNIFTANNGIGNFNQSSVVIDHNLFIHGGFGGLQYATITNNIITSSDGTTVMDGSTNFCTFNANLSLSSNIGPGAPTNSFLGGSNTGGTNQVGVNPLFVSNSDFNNYNNVFNYRLQSGSPGHNTGTDGTDLGIYGGTYPFPSGGAAGSGYDTSAPPPIPQVTGMNIQNASVLPGGQLKVSVQATINN